MKTIATLLVSIAAISSVDSALAAIEKVDSAAPAHGRAEAIGIDSSQRSVILVETAKRMRPELVRFRPNGTLDTSFAEDGVLRPPLAGIGVRLVVQPNGKVVVGGEWHHEVVVRRYRSNGKLDRSFGSRGSVRRRRMRLRALLLQPRGRIVVLATDACPPKSCGYLYVYLDVLRLSQRGRLLHFTRTSFGESWAFEAAGLGPGGSFVVAGMEWEQGWQTFGRFLPSGRLDPSLGGHYGLVIDEFEEAIPVVHALAVEQNRKIVLALDFPGLQRRNADGSLDTTFGTGGIVACGDLVPPSFITVAGSSDEKLIAAGAPGECGLVRYLPDGTPDMTFGSNGFFNAESNASIRPQALALLPDEGVLVAGWDASLGELRLVRCTVDGSLDLRFGDGGTATWQPVPPG